MEDVISVPDGLPNTAFGENFGQFIDQPLLESNHYWIRQPGTQLGTLFKRESFVISTSFHFIQQTNLLQGIRSPGFILFQTFLKLSSAMCPAPDGENPFPVLVNIINRIAVRLNYPLIILWFYPTWV